MRHACLRPLLPPPLAGGPRRRRQIWALLLALSACRSSSRAPSADAGAAAGQAPAAAAAATPAPSPAAASDANSAPAAPVRQLPTCPSVTADSDFKVVVTRGAGFVGGKPFVSRGVTSMNFSQEVVRRPDYVPQPDPPTVALLRALKPAYLRWVPGHDGQLWVWSRDTSPNPLTSNYQLTPALLDAFVAMCRAVGAEPFLALNFKTGSKSQAQDIIRYANQEKGYGITWLQIGNEPDLPADSGLPNPVPLLPTTTSQAADIEAYAARYLDFRDAVRDIDSSVRLVAPEILMGQDMFGFGASYPEWLTPIMQRLGPQIDAISWHYYAKYSGQTDTRSSIFVDPTRPEGLLQENAEDWPTGGMNYVDQMYPKLRQVRDQYNPKAQLWVDEFAEDPGTKYNGQYLADRAVGALWAADLLGRFAEQGSDAVFRFLFKGKADHYYALVDVNNEPRPEYGAYWLYAQVMGESWGWVEHGDPSDVSQLAAHAAARASDGALGVVLVNKTTRPLKVALTLKDFVPYTVQRYTLAGTSYADTSMSINGQTLSQSQVIAGLATLPAQAASPCPKSLVELPAFSAVFLSFGG